MLKLTLTIGLLTACLSANAIPVLQLGPDVLDVSNPSVATDATYVGDGDLNTGADDDTWFLSNDGSSFSFNAYNKGTDGGKAYLVFAATPMLLDENIDYFNLVVSDGTNLDLDMVESGIGQPPVLDPNSLAPHGIFDIYYEIFEFDFDGANVDIGNTEPLQHGGGGTTLGRYETFDVQFSLLNEAVTGIHIDLFTINGTWDEATEDKQLVASFAPFSHDAQVSLVPVPAAVWLFGSGLIGLVGIARRKT